MSLNVNRLTLGEVAKVEELSGMPISAIGDDDRPKGLALAALAFVAKRREDPKYSWNQAQGLTLDEAQDILGMNQPEDDALDNEHLDVPEGDAAPLSGGAKKTRSRKTPAKG